MRNKDKDLFQAGIYIRLLLLYEKQRRDVDLSKILSRLLEIERQLPEVGNVAYFALIRGLMFQYLHLIDKAENFFAQALRVEQRGKGLHHPDIAKIKDELANSYAKLGLKEMALRYSCEATAIVRANDVAFVGDRGSIIETDNPVSHSIYESVSQGDAVRIDHARRQSYFDLQLSVFSKAKISPGQIKVRPGRPAFFNDHLAHLSAVAANGKTKKYGPEAWEVAQSAHNTAAGMAVQQMAVRFSSNDLGMANLIREGQDLKALWRGANDKLIGKFSKLIEQRNEFALTYLGGELKNIEHRFVDIKARIEKEFPDYAALAQPQPLKVEGAQKLLGAEEALVFWLPSDKVSYVFAVTRDGFAWKTLPIAEKALADKVRLFRQGLDLIEVQKSIEAGKPVVFDLALAHELYETLFRPVEPLTKDKRDLLVVPSGALTALPMHLLVTDQSAAPMPPVKDDVTPAHLAVYRDAAWLIKRHAVTVLPSVASLKALRVFARKDQGGKPLVGFGDPVFAPDGAPRPTVAADPRSKVASAAIAPKKTKAAANTRAYTEFWRGQEVDRDQLAQALPPLPESAGELRTVAQKLGAPASDIHLGRDASETTVKHTPLANYRVIYFATHGLVAGDVKGLGEPSLALSLPKEPSDLDDGLLTASEVAQLKLNADWVVLSACNTMAGDKPGAEALSGLARAFFYAGARALLVSHWAVESKAAERLTTATFGILKSDPTLGRAEALRRAMLAYINDKTEPRNAYPGLWGPFSIVGEEAGR